MTPIPTAPLYIVMIDFGKHGFESVTNPDMTRASLVLDIVRGQFDDLAYVIEVFPLEGISRPITEDLALAVRDYAVDHREPLTQSTLEWIADHLGVQAGYALGMEAA